MRTIRFLLIKEFRQIFRNKAILAMILVVPIVQFLILPLAADYEIKNINLSIVDNDHSTHSQGLIAKITASGYFKLTKYNASYKEALKLIESDKADLILEIPDGFERNLIRESKEKVFIAVNAINGTKANLGASYLTSIIGDFNRNLRLELAGGSDFSERSVIEITSSNWFNTLLNYKVFIVPGILAMLVTMVGGFLSALNIVKEKEAGTIEQVNVSPIKKHHFILGKLFPFWILANLVFTIGLVLSWAIYGIMPEGNIFALYIFIAIYLLAIMGFGLLVSTFCQTQQQAMFIMFFFMMVFILMGGLFTPIDSMPLWAQVATMFNPLSHLIQVMRMIILKGSGLTDVLPQLYAVATMAVILNGWAILNYKKTT